MKKFSHLIYARIDKYLDVILIVGSIMAFFGSFFLYVAGNLMIYSLINFIAGIVLLAFFIVAKKIKTSYKIILLIIITFIIAVASYIGASFNSAFMTLFLLANVIAILFLELKASIITTFSFMMFFLCLGYYTIVKEGSTDGIYPIISWGLQYSAYILLL